MKKWLIIYAFLIGFTSMALTGNAAPRQKSLTISTAAVKPQQGFFGGIEREHKQKDNPIVLNLRIRTALSVTVSAAAKESGLAVTCYRTSGMAIVIAETERLQYDYLLHLFPSHYFW